MSADLRGPKGPDDGRDDLRDDGERDLALAVRRAVQDDGAWTPGRLGLLAERAVRRAARRRRRRLVAAPLAGLAAAAAVAAGLLVVPAVVAVDTSVAPATAGLHEGTSHAEPASAEGVEGAARLTTDEVRTVLRSAEPESTLGSPEAGVDATLLDACGTAELPADRPLQRQGARWVSPAAVAVDPGAPAALSATVDAYPDAASAQAAVAQLRDSVDTCRPAAGDEQPTYPVTAEVFLADAFYGASDPDVPGRYQVTAVRVADRWTATVRATVDGVDDEQARSLVAGRVAWLAGDAATRAAAGSWLADGPTSDVPPSGSPVTTAEAQRVVPGAEVAPVLGVRPVLRADLVDACGTAELSVAAPPQQTRSSRYLDPELGDVDLQPGFGQVPTVMGAAGVVVSAATFAEPADAQAYAAAFRASAQSCTPEPGTLPLAPVDLLPEGSADALFTTAYSEATGRYWYTAVVVRDSTAATVFARVPGEPSRAVATDAAQRVVDLATAAATREATRAASAADAP